MALGMRAGRVQGRLFLERDSRLEWMVVLLVMVMVCTDGVVLM